MCNPDYAGMKILHLLADSAVTAIGYCWKAGWAFVLGESVSAMIQAFMPKGRLTPYPGEPDFGSISLATIFGAASSWRSFAVLAAARAQVMKRGAFHRHRSV